MAVANAAMPRLKPDQFGKMSDDADGLIVDVRDPPEVQASGKIKDAMAVSCGMLEFRADPDLPTHSPAFRHSLTRRFRRWVTRRCGMRVGSKRWPMPVWLPSPLSGLSKPDLTAKRACVEHEESPSYSCASVSQLLPGLICLKKIASISKKVVYT